MKRLLALGMSLALALSCLPPALAAEGDGPSPWAAEEVGRAVEAGLVHEAVTGSWHAPITRGEFTRLAIRYLAVEHGFADDGAFVNAYSMASLPDGESTAGEDIGLLNPWGRNGDWWHFSDVSDEDGERAYVNSAYQLGIVNGRTEAVFDQESLTTVQEALFDPKGAITRQEAACMLARSYALLDGADYGGGGSGGYADWSAVADWAVDSVAAVTELGVMGSVSGGGQVFDPLGSYSREQAVVTFLRLHEGAPVCAARGNVAEIRTAAYEKMVELVQQLGDPGTSQVDFRADTEACTVMAIGYRNMMHFSSMIVALYRDGTSRILWEGGSSDWALNSDGTALTFSADGSSHSVSLL